MFLQQDNLVNPWPINIGEQERLGWLHTINQNPTVNLLIKDME